MNPILAKRLAFIAVTTLLLLFGLVVVFSASPLAAITEDQDGFAEFKHQLVMVGIGLVLLAIAAIIPYTVWNKKIIWPGFKVSWIPWALMVVLLIWTLIEGDPTKGAQRWVYIGSSRFQPSEFTKIAMTLLAASLAVQVRGKNITAPWIIQVFALVVVPGILLKMQPDLGTLIISVLGVIIVGWFAELRLKIILTSLGILALIGLGSIILEPYQLARITAYLDQGANASDGAYQTMNSYYALGDGGVFGVGLGMSRQKYGYLPEAHNDFIFAIIGEELGLIGALVVILLFVAFLFIALSIAKDAPDVFGRCVAGTSAALIVLQAFLNIACVTGLMPITGKPLPFFSAGGTSMIATLTLVGLILSVSLRSSVRDPSAARREKFLIYEGGVESPEKNSHKGKRERLDGRKPAPATMHAARRPVPIVARTARKSAPMAAQVSRRPMPTNPHHPARSAQHLSTRHSPLNTSYAHSAQDRGAHEVSRGGSSVKPAEQRSMADIIRTFRAFSQRPSKTLKRLSAPRRSAVEKPVSAAKGAQPTGERRPSAAASSSYGLAPVSIVRHGNRFSSGQKGA